jgi:hypothetical protein
LYAQTSASHTPIIPAATVSWLVILCDGRTPASPRRADRLAQRIEHRLGLLEGKHRLDLLEGSRVAPDHDHQGSVAGVDVGSSSNFSHRSSVAKSEI